MRPELNQTKRQGWHFATSLVRARWVAPRRRAFCAASVNQGGEFITHIAAKQRQPNFSWVELQLRLSQWRLSTFYHPPFIYITAHKWGHRCSGKNANMQNWGTGNHVSYFMSLYRLKTDWRNYKSALLHTVWFQSVILSQLQWQPERNALNINTINRLIKACFRSLKELHVPANKHLSPINAWSGDGLHCRS